MAKGGNTNGEKKDAKENKDDFIAAVSKPVSKKPLKKNQKETLSATQLRNARKRKARKKNHRAQEESNGKPNGVKNPSLSLDPSTQYLSNPQSAPLVQAAKRFFADRLSKFPIYQNGPKTKWRTVSKLPVRRYQPEGSKRSRVMVGMFQPQSHKVGFVTEYPAHHPSINSAMATITGACQEMGIDAYSEHDGSGYLRYVAMNVERSTCKVQLTLIWKAEPYECLSISQAGSNKKRKRKRNTNSSNSPPEGRAQLERLISHLLQLATAAIDEEGMAPKDGSNGKRLRDQTPATTSIRWRLHSLWVHYNAAWKHSNAIFDIHKASPNAWQHVYGPMTIPEQLTLPMASGAKSKNPPTLHFAPNVFRQANLDAFAYIVSAIRQRIQHLAPPHSQQVQQTCAVLELYGGVGTIGLHLLDLPNVASLICSDENPHNTDCFSNSISSFSSKGTAAKATYVPLNATKMVTDERRFLEKCNVLIVDPPRKGLDEVVVEALCNKRNTKDVQLLVYVSCGFDAFQRDYQSLTKQSRWTLEHAEGHVLFPGSNAIETLAFFTPN